MNKAEIGPFLNNVKDTMKTMEFANNDNFAQLMATDNYIEKYLPFKIQEMIEENMKMLGKHLDQCLFKEVYKSVYNP
jgi:hypothetical protein